MSLSSAISSALSGMRATSIAADVAGNNLANAMNENYARREVVLRGNQVTANGGVEVVGVFRHANPVINASLREANGTTAFTTQTAEDANFIQSLYGDPSQSGSLVSQVTNFQQTLVSASARPDITERLGAAVVSLEGLVGKVNDISDGIQDRRALADNQINDIVNQMNSNLQDLDVLNKRIVTASAQGLDTSALLDQQDRLLDSLSSMTDIRIYERDRGAIAIYSSGGSVLLDGKAAEVSFTTNDVITADMSLSGGTLGALMINGEAVTTGGTSGKMRGGELGALFDFRDVTAVQEQQEIDSFAFELANRMNDPTIDPTRVPGDLGFLTDAGGVVDPLDTVGLSARLEVNTTLVPLAGGDPTLLRDGLLAATPGEVGNSALLTALSDTFTTASGVSSGAFSGSSLSLDDFGNRLMNRTAIAVNRTQEAQSFAQAQSQTLQSYKFDQSVDSDFELQNLMRIEQAYAANAQVLRTVDEMIETLLGIA